MRLINKLIKLRGMAFRAIRRIVNPPGPRKVDFVICGVQKGGTTALDSYLREHPMICMADEKEVHFFDTDRYFKGEVDYAIYHSYFSPKDQHILLGEATPLYMYWYDAPRRMWQYNPDMKLIVLLRNPIERAYSHWNMEHGNGYDKATFYEAITKERLRCREALPYQHKVYSYVDRGYYLEQLRRLWTFFPREQVLVIKNEQLRNHPGETMDEICDFLGVERVSRIAPRSVHSREYKSKMTKQEKDYLRSVYEHEIRGIERELDWDCSDWLA